MITRQILNSDIFHELLRLFLLQQKLSVRFGFPGGESGQKEARAEPHRRRALRRLEDLGSQHFGKIESTNPVKIKLFAISFKLFRCTPKLLS